MFPKKETYHNIELLDFLKINNEKYVDAFEAIYQQKKHYYKISLIFFVPVSLVLSFFMVINQSMPAWSFPLYLLGFSILGFLFISLPIYHSFLKSCTYEEQKVGILIDEHLSDLAKQEFFSKDAKAKRLLNQEFELIALTSIERDDLNLILENKSLSTTNCPIINLSNPDFKQSKRIFYENRPLNPIILVKLNLVNRTTKKLSKQLVMPIEFELVRGLVSEQIIYFKKDNYIVNPRIYIDADNFKYLYVSEREIFTKREHPPL